MKKLLALTSLLVAASVASFGAACTQSFNASVDYNSSTVCTINNVTFSNFSWTPAVSGGVQVSGGTGILDGITLTPITTVGSEGFTLVFANMNVVGNQSADIALTYTVSSTTPVYGYAMNNPGVGATGTGQVTITDSFSNGSPVGPNIFFSSTATATSITNNPSVFFSPQTTFNVTKDINVTGNGTGGAAHVSYVSEQNAVPEPMTMSLLGVGLLGLGFFGRRLRK